MKLSKIWKLFVAFEKHETDRLECYQSQFQCYFTLEIDENAKYDFTLQSNFNK